MLMENCERTELSKRAISWLNLVNEVSLAAFHTRMLRFLGL